jgi:hypothetical protein
MAISTQCAAQWRKAWGRFFVGVCINRSYLLIDASTLEYQKVEQ